MLEVGKKHVAGYSYLFTFPNSFVDIRIIVEKTAPAKNPFEIIQLEHNPKRLKQLPETFVFFIKAININTANSKLLYPS